MKYEEIRNSLKSGDIVALSHKDWSTEKDIESQIVKCVTQSTYSHVALVWCIGGRVFLIESVEPLVRVYPLSNLKESFYLVPAHLDMTDAELEFALSKVGVAPYSKLEAIAAQLNLLEIGASESFECAEFVICCRKLSGLRITSKATPAAVMQWLLEHNFELKYVEKR